MPIVMQILAQESPKTTQIHAGVAIGNLEYAHGRVIS